MTKTLFFLLFLPIAATAQTYDFKKAELESRRLVYAYPDSALVLIKRTLAQKGPVHDTVLGNTYNLYGIYYGMKGKPDSTILYTKKSISYLDNYPRNKARSLMNLAIGYRNKGDYATSIKYLNEAIPINKKENNNVGIAIAYGELASNYNLMLEYDKSVDYLLKAINILKAEKNTKQLVAVKQKLANTYLAKNNFKFAIDIYRECLAEFKAIGMGKNYYLTLINMAEALIQTKQLTEAEKALKEAAEGLTKFGDNEITGICYSKIGNLQNTKGQYNAAIASYDKALNHLIAARSSRIVRIAGEYIDLLNTNKEYEKALGIIKKAEALSKYSSANIEDRMVYKNAIADTYSGVGNDKKAIEEYRHAIAIKDSIATNEKEAAVQEIQAKFQTELQREKNLALEASNNALKKTAKAEQRLMLLYIIASIAVIILILSFLRSYWLKTKLQKEELKAIEAERNLIQQQHTHELELINTQKETIEEKQRELTSSALRMANYQDHINQIIEKCDANIYTKVADVKKELQHLIKQKDYWKQFETRFNSLHPDFSTALSGRFSKLTKNDIEFCSLLKLNLSNKEIASLLQISHESAITKKYRIKKKMEITDDAEFEKLLMEI